MHPMSPLAKLVWWREREPETFASVRWWAGVKELVLHALTGELLVDHGTASGTGLRNLHTEDWDEEALALAGLSAERLARLVDGTHAVPLTADVGLPAGTPVVVGGADGPAGQPRARRDPPGRRRLLDRDERRRARGRRRAVGRSRRAHLLLRPRAPAAGSPAGRRTAAASCSSGSGEAVAPDLGTPEAVLDAAAQAPRRQRRAALPPAHRRRAGAGVARRARAAPTSASRARTGAPHLLRAAIEGTCLQLAVVLATLGAGRRDRCVAHGRVRAQRRSGARSSRRRSAGPSASPPPRRARASAPRCSA